MAIETLPESSIPITTPFRPGLGFLTATPIITAATICLALVIASAILAVVIGSTYLSLRHQALSRALLAGLIRTQVADVNMVSAPILNN